MDPLKGMISGLFVKEEKNDDNSTTYYYEQKINVPIYLIGLAAGNIQNITINEIIEVYSEPEYLDKVDDGKILEVLQAGYKIKDRLLRPALVVVSKKKN